MTPETLTEYRHPQYGLFRIGDRVRLLWGGEAVAGNVVRFMPDRAYDVLVSGHDSDGVGFTVDRWAGDLTRLPQPDMPSVDAPRASAFPVNRRLR